MVLRVYQADKFDETILAIKERLIEEEPLETSQWQSRKASSDMTPYELQNVTLVMGIPQTIEKLVKKVSPNLPWAEDHLQERVGGEPLNPPPSEAWWPYAMNADGTTNTIHKEGRKFSHTYPERMWPKYAGDQPKIESMSSDLIVKWGSKEGNKGIRYYYGDLRDVIHLLARDPLTRQAFLPIWFPEDTGVTHGGRVPCTLGYHFMIRNNQVHITYYMRSCDIMRHFRDDVYMASRLAQVVRDELNDEVGKVKYDTGELIMHIASLHCFQGDIPVIERELDEVI